MKGLTSLQITNFVLRLPPIEFVLIYRLVLEKIYN